MMHCERTTPQKFLHNELNDKEVELFEDHLSSCETCRQWLEEDAGGSVLADEVRERLASSIELPIWEGIHASNSQRRSDERSEQNQILAATDLALLNPSDDPASLGRIGMFEVRAIIGRGGMGTVFKAIDPSLGRTVAIKVLRPDLASIGTARQRFSLEARAMATINHSNVVPIFAVDEHRGLPYMAMEYVPGGTLEARLLEVGQLEILSVIRIAHQVAEALEAAHECGLVHRDIKPGNILLDRGVDRVRVADFGLVRVSDDASMTRSGVVAGTPQFMSPEQVRGEACDARSDLFSLGCVLYTLCAGHPPFRADSPYAAMQRIVHDTPRRLRELRRDVPVWLEGLIHRLLEKSPDHRFESARFVTELLEHELSHLQNPTLIPEPDRQWMQSLSANRERKRKRSVRFALIAMVLVLTSASAVYFLRSPANHQEAAKNQSETQSLTEMLKHEPATATLWAREDLKEIRQSASRLQNSLQNENDKLNDPMVGDVHRLRQQLELFERTGP